MAASSNEALRNSGFWLQRLCYWLLSTLGFVIGLGVKFWAALILGIPLLWYGLPNLLSWSSGPPGPATTGPGQYTPLPPMGSGPVALPSPPQMPVPAQKPRHTRTVPADQLPPLPTPVTPPAFATVPDNPIDSPLVRRLKGNTP